MIGASLALPFLSFLLLLAPSSPGALVLGIDLIVSGTHNGKALTAAEITLTPRVSSPSGLENYRSAGFNSTVPIGGKRAGRAPNPVGYSGNWCGASQHTTTPNRFTSVSGIFSVPDLRIRPNTALPQYVAAWVGLDGASCQTTLVQGGTTTEIRQDGTQHSTAWFEWLPDAAYNIPNMPVSPGDMMRVQITAASSSQATVQITNLYQNYIVEVQLSNGSPLCRADAEWIVENFFTNFGQTPFARFDEIWFQQSEAQTVSGTAINIQGATMIYLQNNGVDPNCFAQEWDDTTFFAYSS